MTLNYFRLERKIRPRISMRCFIVVAFALTVFTIIVTLQQAHSASLSHFQIETSRFKLFKDAFNDREEENKEEEDAKAVDSEFSEEEGAENEPDEMEVKSSFVFGGVKSPAGEGENSAEVKVELENPNSRKEDDEEDPKSNSQAEENAVELKGKSENQHFDEEDEDDEEPALADEEPPKKGQDKAEENFADADRNEKEKPKENIVEEAETEKEKGPKAQVIGQINNIPDAVKDDNKEPQGKFSDLEKKDQALDEPAKTMTDIEKEASEKVETSEDSKKEEPASAEGVKEDKKDPSNVKDHLIQDAEDKANKAEKATESKEFIEKEDEKTSVKSKEENPASESQEDKDVKEEGIKDDDDVDIEGEALKTEDAAPKKGAKTEEEVKQTVESKKEKPASDSQEDKDVKAGGIKDDDVVNTEGEPLKAEDAAPQKNAETEEEVKQPEESKKEEPASESKEDKDVRAGGIEYEDDNVDTVGEALKTKDAAPQKSSETEKEVKQPEESKKEKTASESQEDKGVRGEGIEYEDDNVDTVGEALKTEDAAQQKSAETKEVIEKEATGKEVQAFKETKEEKPASESEISKNVKAAEIKDVVGDVNDNVIDTEGEAPNPEIAAAQSKEAKEALEKEATGEEVEASEEANKDKPASESHDVNTDVKLEMIKDKDDDVDDVNDNFVDKNGKASKIEKVAAQNEDAIDAEVNEVIEKEAFGKITDKKSVGQTVKARGPHHKKSEDDQAAAKELQEVKL